jgi:hypothetical protein
MPTKTLDPNNLGIDEDWEGNNAAFRCSHCSKVFIVSGTEFTAASASVRTAANPLPVATSRDGNLVVPQALSGRTVVRQYGVRPVTLSGADGPRAARRFEQWCLPAAHQHVGCHEEI